MTMDASILCKRLALWYHSREFGALPQGGHGVRIEQQVQQFAPAQPGEVVDRPDARPQCRAIAGQLQCPHALADFAARHLSGHLHVH